MRGNLSYSYRLWTHNAPASASLLMEWQACGATELFIACPFQRQTFKYSIQNKMYSYWKLLTNTYCWEVKGVFILLFPSCVWTYLRGPRSPLLFRMPSRTKTAQGMVTTLRCPEDRWEGTNTMGLSPAVTGRPQIWGHGSRWMQSFPCKAEVLPKCLPHYWHFCHF